jgi:hypothetical protein
MKKLFVIGAVSLSMVLASCGGNEADSKSADAKKEGDAEPKTACDCIKWASTEMDKILSMTMDEIAKNPNVGQDFENKMSANTTCEKLFKDADMDEVAKDCPAMSEFKAKAEKFAKFSRMGSQASGDAMEDMPAPDEAMEGDGAYDMPDGEMEEMDEAPAEGDM